MGRRAKAPRSEASSGSEYRWETEAPTRWDADGPDELDTRRQDFEGLSRAECGFEFYRMLLSLKGSKLSAKETSLLAFWACGAGAEGDAKDADGGDKGVGERGGERGGRRAQLVATHVHVHDHSLEARVQ